MTTFLIPHLTEKTYALAKDLNIYVFKLEKRLNQQQIQDLVQAEYKVEITKIRTLVAKGKKARSIRTDSRAKRIFGQRKTIKKAYITLKEGDVIPIFTDATDKNSKT